MDKQRLDSWKEIAAYLGRDVRTVTRWEQQRGLPVHRIPGGQRSRVFAHPEELDAWLARTSMFEPEVIAPTSGAASEPRQRVFRRHWRMAAAVVGTIFVAVGWVLTRAADPPRRLAVVGRELLAFDASDQMRWVHRFEATSVFLPDRWSHIGDLNRDGRDEVLATMQLSGPGLTRQGGQLLSFSADGGVQWTSTLDDRVAFRDGEYGPPWMPADLAVYHAGGEARIAWVVHHLTWWPGLLVTLNAQGQRLGTFVNSGWIRGAHQSPDGRYLFVTGVTNSRQAYFVAVLDADRPTGHSPEPPGSTMECVTCPSGDPLHYFVFPRTDVGREQPFPIEGPGIELTNSSVQIQTPESRGPNFANTIYELSPELTVRDARFSDSFWEWHRRLEEDGKLHHRGEECPERRGLGVQHWTRGEGWTALHVTVR